MVVFFDIDDTLLTHTSAKQQAALRFWEHFRDELAHTGPHFLTLWNQLAEQHMAAFLAGAISFTEQRRRRIRALFPAAMTEGEADQRFSTYLRHYELAWAAFPDVIPCLTQLTGHTLGIISNGHTAQQRKKLEVLGIAAQFAVVMISEDIGKAKPDPQIFLRACQQAMAPPTQCWYVGDRLDTDARAARAAGLTGVWLNRTAPERVAPDVMTIHDLRALPQVLGVER